MELNNIGDKDMTTEQIIARLAALEAARASMTFEEYIRQRSIMLYKRECREKRGTYKFKQEQSKISN
jgi:hypothetical protein